VTNTTVFNNKTMCELLRKIAGMELPGPITLVLDNARYQRNAVVQALAVELGLSPLFLPSYSPNLNLIERFWKFIKRRALYGRYQPTFRDFRAAIKEALHGLPTKYAALILAPSLLNPLEEPLKRLQTPASPLSQSRAACCAPRPVRRLDRPRRPAA
jgi:transposase